MRVLAAMSVAVCWWTVGETQPGGGSPVTTRVIREGDLDQARVGAIGKVVVIAKETLDALFPECAKKPIALQISPRDSWWPNTVTDRDRTIYVQLGTMGGRGIGEFGRGDAGPVGMLCEAVVELHNPQRIAGLNRYLAHRHLVPAVVEELGPWAIPSDTSTPLAADGLDMLALITDPTYASMHPNFAAAGALGSIEDALGLEGLRALIAGIPKDADDPFAALRTEAVAQDATLEQAFELYDEAAHVEIDEAGCVTLASFEEEETVTAVTRHPLPAVFDPLVLWPASLDAEQTDEWASDGDQSLKLSTQAPRPDMGIGISDPDWRLKDWSRFTRFDMDVRLEGDEPQAIQVRIEDDIAMGHGELSLFRGVIQPGETRHITCSLDPRTIRGYKSSHGEYYSGSFRWDEVASLVLLVNKPTQPFTMYIDGLRLSTGDVPQRDRAPGLVSDFEEEDLPLWQGLNPEYELTTEGDSAGRWERPDSMQNVTLTMPMDWSEYDLLEFDCHSGKANNDRFIFCIQSMAEPRPGGREDYWAYIFDVDWTGWKQFSIPFRRLRSMRRPAGWDKVTAVRMWSTGWGMSADPETELVFDNMRLTKAEPRPVPEGVIDDFEDGPWAWWWMDEGSVPAHSGEHCGEFPLDAGWRRAYCQPRLADWAPYDELRFWVYAEKLDGEVLRVHVSGSEERIDVEVPLDGDGWHEVVAPLTKDLGRVSSLLVMINNFSADDFGKPNRELDPEAVLCLDDIRLTKQ